MRRGVLLAMLMLGGCLRVGSLDGKHADYALSSRQSDHRMIECVQRQWEARGAQVSTVATPHGVRLTARSALYSSRLFAVADVSAFTPERILTVRASPHGHGYARVARACT